MKRTILTAVCLLLAVASVNAETMYNKYGMKLRDKDGELVVSGIRAYKAAGINLKNLPDVNEPYKVEYTCFDKDSWKGVKKYDEVYKTTKFGQEMHLLVYKSPKQNAPVVFFIHGGGWVGGKYTSSQSFFKTLAGKYGITAVSIEYTFATVDGARVADTIEDCYDAVEYILGNASKYGIDPKRVGFVGSSAGGHLSSMCALHFPQTKAYVGLYGAYDLEYSMSVYAPAEKGEKHDRYNFYLKGWNPKYIAKFSPVNVAASMKNIGFKSILFAGTADLTIGYQNAPLFADALRKGGAKDVEVCTYENVTHSMFRSCYADEIYFKTMEFFSNNL